MRPTKRRQRRGSRQAECIPKKPCFKAAIQSEVKARKRKTNSQGVKGTKRKSRQKREIKKRRGSREDECVPSKARYNAAIQSVATATQSEETDETDEEKAKEREQTSRMHSVETLL
jgi:hypothetical protein